MDEQEVELELLTPAQVGELFGVNAKTVSRWASSNPPKIDYVLTPGGHKRYVKSSVEALFDKVNPISDQTVEVVVSENPEVIE